MQRMTNVAGRRRVLLIDDEPSIVKIVGRRLAASGYEVFIATDGQDGLAKIRIGRPDIVLLDLMLPKLSGLEVCAAVKSDASLRHIPVIIFTAKGEAADEQLCRECGANACIDKPKGTAALLEQIDILLTRWTGASPPEASAASQTPGVP